MSAIPLDTQTLHQLLQDAKPALVEFWAPWCSHCIRLEDAFHEIAQEYGEQLAIGKVNIDEYPALAAKYYIEYVPTLAIFAEGELIDFVIAPNSREAIARFIEEIL